MKKTNQLNVFYNHRKVGRLAVYKQYLAAFEYGREWLENGFSISPFSLPLQKGVFLPKVDPFEGLFGIFADSLPDGFGRLLVDRLLLSYHLDPMKVGSLSRLAIVGNSGMGALTYQPDIHFVSPRQDLDYNILMRLTLEITKSFAEVQRLYRLMCFNVFAHNRDDHSKNFTYLYNAEEDKWVLSPAYDLTYSYSLNGEHATTINGEGQNPGLKDLTAVAKNIGISESTAKAVAFDVHDCVKENLSKYFT